MKRSAFAASPCGFSRNDRGLIPKLRTQPCNPVATEASYILLILLSRINGDAPAHKTISAGRLDSSRAGLLRNFPKPLVFESIRTWSFDRHRFAEARPVRKLLLIPKEER